MPPFTDRHIEAYVFRRRGRRVEFLALRRSPDRALLPGVWQPVTSKRNLGERSLAAAAREVREETGLKPRKWWALEAVSVYFDAAKDHVAHLPAYVAEIGAEDHVRLSGEHDAFEFLSARDAGRRFLWDGQRRALDAVRRQILDDDALSQALDVTHLLRRRRAARGAGRGRRAG